MRSPSATSSGPTTHITQLFVLPLSDIVFPLAPLSHGSAPGGARGRDSSELRFARCGASRHDPASGPGRPIVLPIPCGDQIPMALPGRSEEPAAVLGELDRLGAIAGAGLA